MSSSDHQRSKLRNILQDVRTRKIFFKEEQKVEALLTKAKDRKGYRVLLERKMKSSLWERVSADCSFKTLDQHSRFVAKSLG